MLFSHSLHPFRQLAPAVLNAGERLVAHETEVMRKRSTLPCLRSLRGRWRGAFVSDARRDGDDRRPMIVRVVIAGEGAEPSRQHHIVYKELCFAGDRGDKFGGVGAGGGSVSRISSGTMR